MTDQVAGSVGLADSPRTRARGLTFCLCRIMKKWSETQRVWWYHEGRDGHRPRVPTRASGNGTVDCMTSRPTIESGPIVEFAKGSLRDE